MCTSFGNHFSAEWFQFNPEHSHAVHCPASRPANNNTGLCAVPWQQMHLQEERILHKLLLCSLLRGFELQKWPHKCSLRMWLKAFSSASGGNTWTPCSVINQTFVKEHSFFYLSQKIKMKWMHRRTLWTTDGATEDMKNQSIKPSAAHSCGLTQSIEMKTWLNFLAKSRETMFNFTFCSTLYYSDNWNPAGLSRRSNSGSQTPAWITYFYALWLMWADVATAHWYTVISSLPLIQDEHTQTERGRMQSHGKGRKHHKMERASF